VKTPAALSSNKNGFFLMVEGSKVDRAAHANDPVGIVSDVIAFDRACTVALDYAAKDKNTVVIDNTEIAKYIEPSLGLDLAATTDRLVVKKGGVELAIVQNRDYAIAKGLPKTTKGVYVLGKDADGKEVLALKADGVAVNNGKNWFVSRNLIDAIK